MKTLTERFLKYVSYPTMSDEKSETCPSTEKQKALGEFLVKELREIGLTAEMDEHGYVYGSLPSNCGEGHPKVAFIAHMDTSDVAADSPIKPRILFYEGGEIVLNEEENIVTDALSDEFRGLHIIVTDGKTLLGADDKAGVAEIVDAVARLAASGEPHGDIKICFTPDEEIGRGADLVDLDKLGADYGYTVDGGELGGIEYENFNAASARVEINGFSVHPGAAFGTMKNASLIALEFASLLPSEEVPEKTKDYEGFYHLVEMSGEIEHAELVYIIRDHDKVKFEEKKQKMAEAALEIDRRYGEGTAAVTIRDSYYNMKEVIEKHPHVLRRAEDAMRAEGVEPISMPIRGGTDGARLSFMGLPCPNLCTGGHMFHSRFEFAVVEHMEKCSDIVLRIMKDTAKF
ncbi:MAG: peptidase T [Ruminococcaceae bacterium]|nr:peptidase T [Oscillospiraceae bacterium]